jgi:tetratricopeptide (TPR) repeat protein
MQRRDLQRGATEARDRARHRGRRSRTAGASDPLERLGDHLDQMVIPRPTAVDLDRFARETSHLDVSLGERLRQLAIHLEYSRGVHAWSVLAPVYAASLRADPDNADAWSSAAIARWHNDADTQTVAEACVASCRRAVALAPADGHPHGVLGMLLYQAGHLDEAITVLQHAIGLGRVGWPHLWLAHALHDLERWPEAAAAYAEIPAAALPPQASWRLQLAREQRAACLYRAGQREAASRLYGEVLTRFERALDAGLDALASPVLATGAPSYLMADLAAFPELRARCVAVVARLGDAPPSGSSR